MVILTQAMNGLSLITVAALLYIQTANTQEQATRTCSTDEMRRAVVDRALDDLGCDNYECGKSY